MCRKSALTILPENNKSGCRQNVCGVSTVYNDKPSCKYDLSFYDSCKTKECATNQLINHIYIRKLEPQWFS